MMEVVAEAPPVQVVAAAQMGRKASGIGPHTLGLPPTMKVVSAVKLPSESGSVPLNCWFPISKVVSKVKLPRVLGMVPVNLFDPVTPNFAYVRLVRDPISGGIMAPGFKEMLPEVDDTGMPVMYPALSHLKRPEPPVLPPKDVQVAAAAHCEYRG